MRLTGNRKNRALLFDLLRADPIRPSLMGRSLTMRIAFFFGLWHFPQRVLATRTASAFPLPFGRPGLRFVVVLFVTIGSLR